MLLLVKAKHWQIFVLTIGIQLIYKIMLLFYVGSRNELELFDKYKPILSVISAFFIFMWIWQVALALYIKSKKKSEIEIIIFKIVFSYLIIYFLFIVFSVFFFNRQLNPVVFFEIVTPFAIIYCVYFIAKYLKLCEIGTNITFSHYLKYLLLILVFPIGIWVIQPRINKLHAQV